MARGFPNPIRDLDALIRENIKWENTKIAGDYSDYFVGISNIYPYAYAMTEKHHRVKRMTTIAAIQLISVAFNDISKIRAKRLRPNKFNKKSFYSGHTSSAFTNAGLICMQDKGKHRIHCKTSIVLAASVAYLRVAGDWHWFSDVAVGAGVGYMNGKFIPELIMSF